MDLLQGIIFLIVFFFLILLSLYCGTKLAKWQHAHDTKGSIFGYQILEGSVFTLMGLIVAFTFANSNQKLDERRLLIIEEANSIRMAYSRIDLLPPNVQPILHSYFKQYLSARLATYEAIPNVQKFHQEIQKTNDLQNKIWDISVSACRKSDSQITCLLTLPTLNNMFSIAKKRIAITELHPPLIIFYLLIGLALLSSFLAGYDIKETERRRSMIFIISYAIIIALTVYIILDMEYPRVGFIRIDPFDVNLKEVLTIMK